jgi:hypothetical protein
LHPRTFGLSSGAKERWRDGCSWGERRQNILTRNVGKNEFWSTFQRIS